MALSVPCASLGGCYDLSTSGPRPEDFTSKPAPSEPEETHERPGISPETPVVALLVTLS